MLITEAPIECEQRAAAFWVRKDTTITLRAKDCWYCSAVTLSKGAGKRDVWD